MAKKIKLMLCNDHIVLDDSDDLITSSKLLQTMIKDLHSNETVSDWEIVESEQTLHSIVIPIVNVTKQDLDLLKALLKDTTYFMSLDMWDTAHMLNVCNFLDIPNVTDSLIKRWIDLAGHMSDQDLTNVISNDVQSWSDAN